ncbi:MAG: formate--tetrahydrofolate ligase [Bacteroidaceae bacterium]|nr:formate--tetrahydrofolate ligase [Bacteroidaceae bacterium]
MKTDIEIARSIELKKIKELAKSVGMPEDHVTHYGRHMAKVDISLIDEEKIKNNHLILVTAITPTKAGIGKTTVSVGLALGLNHIGKNAIVALREPSLGPCFGMKGGAAGGGYAQVLPMEKINLHFTGDFHAITSANNMISALLDNYIYQNRDNGFGLKEILWRRVLDVNDRSLRYIVTGLGPKTNGITQESGFDITPASEIMAILCLAKDEDDLRRRIENILLGFTYDNKPFTVKDLGVAGAITVLLKDALSPNLVQTTENTPAFVHGGPFANIAHGCNSVLATKLAMTFGDYAITEAGFGADLGAEKFYDIKCRKAGLNPKLTVLVVTARALKMHGGVSQDIVGQPNLEALKVGIANMDKHLDNLLKFGQNVVVAFNRYGDDVEDEIDYVRQHCAELGIGFAVNNAFVEGGKGAVELANLVVKTIEENPSKELKFAYKDEDEVKDKVCKVACNLYGAKLVTFSPTAKKKLAMIEELGYTHFPICIAKTQYSFSTNAKLVNVPKDFEFHVQDIVINAGAEILVVISGEIMRMPGLPKNPQALHIDIVNGQIEGLS